MKSYNPQPATNIHNQLFLNHAHNQTGFGKPVSKFAEETLFTWVFR